MFITPAKLDVCSLLHDNTTHAQAATDADTQLKPSFSHP
jgi:hypothetical protein